MEEAKPAKPQRAANWDLLRTVCMFLVVVVHTSGTLGPINGFPTENLINGMAFICDPIFFALSGYFAIKPLRQTLTRFYLGKVSAIIFPLILYSILLYLWNTRLEGMSLFGYLYSFTDLMERGWWFIPALVPCLVAAPFLSKGFEALSDRMLAILAGILAALYLYGAVFTFIYWVCGMAGLDTASQFSELMTWLLPSAILSQGTAYFQFFILGGIFRRLAPRIGRRSGNILIAIGAVAFVVDVVLKVLGSPRADPSYFWVFSTFAAFIITDRISIQRPTACRLLSWTAQRSYTIYLVQYTTIAISLALIYYNSAFDGLYYAGAIGRIVVWLIYLIVAYLLALGVASVIDPLVLNPLQRLFKRHVIAPLPQKVTGEPEPDPGVR